MTSGWQAPPHPLYPWQDSAATPLDTLHLQADDQDVITYVQQVGNLLGVAMTAVKNTGYAAQPGEFVPVDISSGSVAITLPPQPADQTRVVVKIIKVSGTPGSTTATVTAAPGDVFNVSGGSTALTLQAAFQGMQLQYQQSSGIWYVSTIDTPLGVSLGSAKLGTDGTVGGPGGSPITAGVTAAGSAAFDPTVVVNVKYPPSGTSAAKGDGVTDDTAAIMACEALLTGGGVLYFPAGTYMVSYQSAVNAVLYVRNSNVTWRGAGRDATTIRLSPTSLKAALLVGNQQAITAKNVTIEGITWDHNRQAFSSPFNVNTVTFTDFSFGGKLTFRYNRVVNIIGTGLNVSGGLDADVYGNLFEAPGNATGNAIGVGGVGGVIRIVDNDWRYVSQGIIASPGAGQIRRLIVERNRGDLGWYSRVAALSGAANATYGPTTLNDSGNPFGSVVVGQDVRVMTPLVTASAPTSYGNDGTITDNAQNFTSLGVARGMLVRTSGGKFGIVQAVASTHVVQVEQWLDDSDRYPSFMPASTETYTLYSSVFGTVRSATAGTITVYSWQDFNGNISTPAGGTYYEVLAGTPVYNIIISANVLYGRVARNIMLRGWADQIAIQTSKMDVIENHSQDCWNSGILINSGAGTVSHVKVRGNTCYHNGANGISFFSVSDSEMCENLCIDNNGFNIGTSAGTAELADIKLDNVTRVTATDNILDHENAAGATSANGILGVFIGNDAGGSSDITLGNLRSHNHTNGIFAASGVADLNIFGGNVETIQDSGTRTVVRNVKGYNPVGVVTPAVPATTVPVAAQNYDRTFYVTAASGGPVAMAISGGPTVTIPATAVTSVHVQAGQTVTPTYGAGNAPTWVVNGE